MSIARSLIPELDEIVRHGDPRRRATAARGITELFLQGAATFGADHVDLFDGVLIDLVPHTELAARADLAERLSLLANAPRTLVGQLARENAIAIAGPLLRRSPVIDEQALIAIARVKGQGHLLAGSIDIVRRRHDPILIVGKAVGLEWATVRALILLRLGPNRVPSPADIESARVNFGRLMPSTAERQAPMAKQQ
jgi:uncharacterized protein (DUF2336 family)